LAPIIPITMSICEYEYYVNTKGFAPWPPYKPSPDYAYPPGSLEAKLVLKSPQWETVGIDCARGPASQVASGSWGWLDVSGSCVSEVTLDGWVHGDTGENIPNSQGFPQACRNRLLDSIDSVVYLPIYDGIANNQDGTGEPNGTNAWYHIEGYTAFYLTGLRAGPINNKASFITGDTCSNQETCLMGFFLEGGLIPLDQLPADSTVIPGGTSGAVVVRLTE
jgi:hypothetical protein